MIARVISQMAHLAGSTESLRGQLARGGLGSAILKGLHMILALALAILLARVLGPEGYGVFAFALSVVTLLAIPAQVGLPNLLIREVARYHLKAQWSLLRGLLRWANGLVLLLTSVIVVLAAGSAWYLIQSADGASSQLQTFYWALALVPLLALGNLRGATLRGFRRVVQGQFPEMILRPGILIFLVLVATISGNLTPPTAMALNVVAAALSFLIGAYLLVRNLPIEIRDSEPIYQIASWKRSVLPLSLIAGMSVIHSQTDIVMLGALATKEEVGIYRVAWQGSVLVLFGLGAINMVVAPYIARIYASGDRERLQHIVTISARGIFAFALPVALLFVIFGEWILGFAFGEPYQAGYKPLAILCIAQLIGAAFGPVDYLLNMTGNERVMARGVAVSTISNVILNLVLIPLFGTVGAALATLVSMLLWKVLSWRFAYRLLSIESTFIGSRIIRLLEKNKASV